jgi:hypothetical protein
MAGRMVPNLLYDAKTILAAHPSIALPLARIRGHGYPFGPGTEMVIEGFPRSGTSFAVSAFELPQARKPVIAHHVHAPAQLIAAARRKVPALVLLREPEGSVLSLAIRKPEIEMRRTLRGYVRFYRPLLPYRDRMVVATFDQVVTDFGEVMKRVNRRFGTSWRPFEHTEQNVRRCLEAIDEYTRPTVREASELERIVARPSDARDRMKGRLLRDYRSQTPEPLRRAAEAIHETFATAAKP